MTSPAVRSEVAAIVTRLKNRRMVLGLSQNRVAALMGTQQSAVSEIEAGITCPTLATTLKYAAAVGLRLEWGERPVRELSPGDSRS